MIQPQDNLILVADDDKIIRDTVCKFMEEIGFKTVSASNGAEALKIFKKQSPQLVIVDILMPVMKGTDFLKEVRKFDSTTPVIITTGYPDMNTVIEAIHHGAYDYLTKPFQLEMLRSKVTQALNTMTLVKENTALSGLASLHTISNKLSNTHEVSEILDVTFQFCIDVMKAQKASILLVDKVHDSLQVVRTKKLKTKVSHIPLTEKNEWPISRWVVKNAQSVLIADEISTPITDIAQSDLPTGSTISIPLKANEEVIGVINLNRTKKNDPFLEVDLNTMNVLALQAGTAINNANLYNSLNQKVSELSLICNYSQNFVGLVELDDVIKNLFETIRKYFLIDFIGFLIVKKRFHEFIYWKRGTLSEEYINEIVEATVKKYNTVTKSSLITKRVKPVFLKIAPQEDIIIKTPLNYAYVTSLVWEDYNFGASQTRIALIGAKLYNDMKENYIRTIKALAIAVDAKDTYTHGHSENVMHIAEAIAEEMNVDSKTIGVIRDGGLLHDIGKIGIPGHILNKPGPLTDEEFDGVMKTHSTLGANIVKDVPFLQELYTLILHHHENYDGSGYPDGLKGEEIPISARIIRLADAFEAMTSKRPYRNSLGKLSARDKLLKGRGLEFDPKIIDAFIRVAKRKGWLEENSQSV
jgi:putative nucleotidyltransferase with HDIG domain